MGEGQLFSLQQVLGASQIEVLSDRDDKLVEVVRDEHGLDFVRRSYSSRAVVDVEKVGLPFHKAWEINCQVFTEAGIAIVPSSVFYPTPVENESRVVIASEFVEGVDVKSSSLEVKIKLAAGLGNLIRGSNRFFPDFEVFMPDMFRVNKTGVEQVLLIDVDPYLLNMERQDKDMLTATNIERVSDLLWTSWSEPAERRDVMSSFFRPLTPFFRESEFDSLTFLAMSLLQSRTQGIDLRI